MIQHYFIFKMKYIVIFSVHLFDSRIPIKLPFTRYNYFFLGFPTKDKIIKTGNTFIIIKISGTHENFCKSRNLEENMIMACWSILTTNIFFLGKIMAIMCSVWPRIILYKKKTRFAIPRKISPWGLRVISLYLCAVTILASKTYKGVWMSKIMLLPTRSPRLRKWLIYNDGMIASATLSSKGELVKNLFVYWISNHQWKVHGSTFTMSNMYE